MIDNSMKGGKTYNRCLTSARENNQVGVHKHMFRPQPPTSRLGFAGKRPNNKTLKSLGLDNFVTAKPTQKSVSIPVVSNQPDADYVLRQKLEAQRKAQLAQAMQVPQFGNVYLKLKNSVG